MGDLSKKKIFLTEKTMFKSYQIKSNHRVLRKNEVDTYGAPVFVPDYSTTVLAANMCANSNEHSMYFFLKKLLL